MWGNLHWGRNTTWFREECRSRQINSTVRDRHWAHRSKCAPSPPVGWCCLFSAPFHKTGLYRFVGSSQSADRESRKYRESRILMAQTAVFREFSDNLPKQSTVNKCLTVCLCWTDLPLTCCSRLRMTATAWWRMRSFVWGFSLFKWSWHIRPSSLNASLISRTRRRSLALLAIRLSFSLSIFCSGFRSSSSLVLLENSRKSVYELPYRSADCARW